MLDTNRPRRLVLLLLVIALPLAVAACGDDDDEASTEGVGTTAATSADDGYGGKGTPTTGGATGDATVTISSFSYDDVTVKAGETITIANETSTPHTFTADDDSFDSGQIAADDTGEVTAPDEAGDYAFHCEIHSDMQATLTVE